MDFKINGQWMGEEINVTSPPHLGVAVEGTAELTEVVVVRDGLVCPRVSPQGQQTRLAWDDDTFSGTAYYHIR